MCPAFWVTQTTDPLVSFHLVGTHLGMEGGGGSSLLYLSIAYFMQKGGGWVQTACKIVYILNGSPLI